MVDLVDGQTNHSPGGGGDKKELEKLVSYRIMVYSSLEHVDEGRRGSLPLVSSPYGDSLESVSTTSKLANFFTKKGFKTNLKRTKSATKLDRKRSSPNLSERDATVVSDVTGELTAPPS
ncbi:hypothetical protein RRG08_020983 [Elysia crispata]|uniref:Ras/Rap GTPase-activating protein SynGAP-like PH domain-containing protein n=1 Tax=Elysia crispata TaxID=231223 RepID=A0AAE1DJJ2_9GAST|nr:hypothetical protein RRG08_020983 [Elysia crispata]